MEPVRIGLYRNRIEHESNYFSIHIFLCLYQLTKRYANSIRVLRNIHSGRLHISSIRVKSIPSQELQSERTKTGTGASQCRLFREEETRGRACQIFTVIALLIIIVHYYIMLENVRVNHKFDVHLNLRCFLV